MTLITCSGNVVTDSSGVALCQDAGGNNLPWTSQPAFSISDLDPVLASGAFAAGFVVIAMGFVVGHAYGMILNFISR